MKEKIFDNEFFSKLNLLNMNIKMRLSQGAGGGRKSNAKGTSVEFSDFREYNLGDDFRRIDWNAYGRLDKLYIKLFMEEKEAIFNLFIDASASMDYGESNKSTMALRIAGALSYIVLNNLDRVAINTLRGNTLTYTKGVTGKQSFQKLINELTAISFNGVTNLNKAIMSKQLNTRGVSVIISDFFDSEGIEEAVKYLLYRKQEVILVQVLAREEVNPEFQGVVNLIDSETEDSLKLSLTPQVLKVYQKELADFTGKIQYMCSKLGVGYIRVVSDESIDKVLFDSFTSSGIIRRI